MKIREVKELRPKVSSHLSTTARCPENPNSQDGKETKAAGLPARNPSTPKAKGGAE